MDMPKPQTPEADRRNAQTAAMLTKAEKDAVARFARRSGRTISQAARYLMLKALAEEDATFTPDEG